jgi:hypothetical protein
MPISHTEIADTQSPSRLRASSSFFTLAGRSRSATPSAYHSQTWVSRRSAVTLYLRRAEGFFGPALSSGSRASDIASQVSPVVATTSPLIRTEFFIYPNNDPGSAATGANCATGLPCFVIKIERPVRATSSINLRHSALNTAAGMLTIVSNDHYLWSLYAEPPLPHSRSQTGHRRCLRKHYCGSFDPRDFPAT